MASNYRKLVTREDGKHKEWFWNREFPEAYQWLFAQTTGFNKQELNINLAKNTFFVPNPTSFYLDITCATTIDCIKVFDEKGSPLLKIYPKSLQCNLDISKLANGNYIILIESGDASITRKIVITH